MVPEGWSGSGPLPQWVRLLGNFPKGGKASAGAIFRAQTKGQLSPVLKAKIAWVGARNDRAWYALGHAKQRRAFFRLGVLALLPVLYRRWQRRL